MKNLMIWINDKHDFSPEAHNLVKIQIDNSQRLGWKSEDILLVTNFPYEYNGIRAISTKDENFCAVRPRSTNTTIIPALVDEGIITQENIYWIHDFDAFQVNPITDEELGLEDYDAGFTDYGWKPRWCMGSFFVKASVKPFIELVNSIVHQDIEDEEAVQVVIDSQPATAQRIKRMNITYNIGQRRVDENMAKANYDPKVFHFHPSKGDLIKTFAPLMPPEMADVFALHGHA